MTEFDRAKAALARNLTALMAEDGLSYRDAGTRCGVAPAAVWRMVNQPAYNPSLRVLAALAESLSVPVGALLVDQQTIEEGS